MIQPLSIGNRPIGPQEPCYVIAEAGVNHNGDTGLAMELIDAASDAGSDAVKFQIFRTNALVSRHASTAPYQEAMTGSGSQQQMLEALELPINSWQRLADHARDAGLDFLCTAFDLSSLDLLLALGVPALKCPSGELTNVPFVHALAQHGLPLLISTGMGTIDEVAAALDAASLAPAVALFHCISAYPTPLNQSNLRAITTMREKFGVQVGWSDHTQGFLTSVTAVALGATILEKHLTLDNALPGPDHQASEDPSAFLDYVDRVRKTEAALGNGEKVPMPAEIENRKAARRSLHAVRNLSEGSVVEEGDVVALRPEGGLPPGTVVEGCRLSRPVAKGQALRLEDLDL